MRFRLVIVACLGIAVLSCAPSSATPSPTTAVATNPATAAPVASPTVAPTVAPTAAVPSESAAVFLTRQIELSFKAQWGARWDVLLPVHQAIVTRERYIMCSLQTQPLTGTPQITVTGSREEEFGSPALGLATAPTTLVSITLVQPGPPPSTQTFSQHAWNVAGQWRWGLGAGEYNAFKNSPTACS
jgi:hypothetical protein